MEGTGRDFPDKGNGEPKPGKQGRLQDEGKTQGEESGRRNLGRTSLGVEQ